MTSDPDLKVNPPGAHRTEQDRRRALWAAMFGTLIEYYDFYLYALVAAIALGPLFFPQADPTVGLIASFATLAVGWFARPVGALIMSLVGDRLGRKNVLLITVLLMGIATFLIGILPTYSSIGVAAPIMLVFLRTIQGLAAGGEFAGALLMSVEYARPNRRGRASTATTFGQYGGIILANVVLLAVSLLPEEQFMDWGWRVPFLASAALLAVGVLLRARVKETPVFEAARKTSGLSERPVTGMIRTQRRPLLRLVGVMLIVATATAFYTSYLPAYAIQSDFSASAALAMSLVGTIVGFVVAPAAAAASDHLGRRRVASIGAVLNPFLVWIAFESVGQGSLFFVIVAGVLAALAQSLVLGPVAVWVSEFFPTRYRYSGASIGYQVSSAIGAGIFPLAAASLMAAAGGPPHFGLVVAYVAVIAAVSLVAMHFSPETSRATFADLDGDEPQESAGSRAQGGRSEDPPTTGPTHATRRKVDP
ncbi:MFS transporter [Actinomycetospora sp. NBRC 106375]|uniref:MFS transporter n=1 Tax=Actinomycetospora sp. NBRC 106375 TaxID=3032207 RepID=UPI0024A34028|nr:MFS transporter [Actinomycetospora sp. NBRC 106375]GLZ49863.1 MFS transporter [Actinomycetospora sp. NBRC 106375]